MGPPQMVGPGARELGLPSPQGHPWPLKTPKPIPDLGPGPMCLHLLRFRATQPSMWGTPCTKQQVGCSKAVPAPRGSVLRPEAPLLLSKPTGSQRCLFWVPLLASGRAGRGPQNVYPCPKPRNLPK